MHELQSISRSAPVGAILLLGLLTGLPGARPLEAASFSFTVEQLTTNGLNPQVSGGRVVWEGTGGTGTPITDREIFLWENGATTQLTANGDFDGNARVSSAGVLWERGTGNNAEMYWHDGVSETRLTNNAVREQQSSLSGNRAAWVTAGTGTSLDIVIWDGVNAPVNITAALPPTANGDTLPQMKGNNTVWMRSGPPNKIMLHNGTSITEIATSNSALADPVSDGRDMLAWENFKDRIPNPIADDREIYLKVGSNPTINISDNDHPDFDPQVSDGTVTWWGGQFNDNQVFMWKDGVQTKLSSTGLNQLPKIDGPFIVWQGWDGFFVQGQPNPDLEIFLWDGFQVHQLTDNDIDDTMPQISGNHIVWQAGGGIYHATFVVPEPSSLLLAAVGLAALAAGAARGRRKRA